jgi:hypothetical protein
MGIHDGPFNSVMRRQQIEPASAVDQDVVGWIGQSARLIAAHGNQQLKLDHIGRIERSVGDEDVASRRVARVDG